MPRRRARAIHHEPWFNGGTLINVLGIPILTAIFIGGGYYYTTQDVLARHTAEIAKEAVAREAAVKEENEAREKIRSALVGYADKTQSSIERLTTNAMVTNEHMKGLDSTLDRVVNGLQRIEQNLPREPASPAKK